MSYVVYLYFVKELARMRINLASSGIIVPDVVSVSCQTPGYDDDDDDDDDDDEETLSEDEQEQRSPSLTSLEEERDGSRADNRLPELINTEQSPLVEDSLDEPEATPPQTIQKPSKKQKRKKQTRKGPSRKQVRHHSPYPRTAVKGDTEMGDDGTRDDFGDDARENTISSKMNVQMENKVVFTNYETLCKFRKPFLHHYFINRDWNSPRHLCLQILLIETFVCRMRK